MEIQSLLNKYSSVPINSLNLDKDILDIEKDIIFEKESQKPNLVTSSSRPFDKNYCYYELPLNNSIKENIFPKFKYSLKEEQQIKPLDIDTVFNEKNDIFTKNLEKEIKMKKIELIKNKQYTEYIPKIKTEYTLEQIYSKEKDHNWYIINDNGEIGPFNDFNLYKNIKDIYTNCILQKKPIPYYLIKEEKSAVYLTMEECFDKLNKKYTKEIQKHLINSNLNLNTNMIFYPNQTSINNNIKDNQIKQNNININSENKNSEKKDIDVNDFFDNKKI